MALTRMGRRWAWALALVLAVLALVVPLTPGLRRSRDMPLL
jgi:hypothetical protein